MLRPTHRPRLTGPIVASIAVALAAAACGGGTPSPTPAAATVAPTQAVTDAPSSPAPTRGPTGPANLEAAASVEAGSEFEVSWTGPNAQRDFVTIVTPTATAWTTEDYFYVTDGNPGKLTAPATPGEYVLWYVSGADRTVLFRLNIEVTAFQATVTGPAEVAGNTEFEVSWTGPNGPGDYVTIVKKGATEWVNEDYFYTNSGANPDKLLAPIEAGDYELWYVLGASEVIAARQDIKVLAVNATLQGPDTALRVVDIVVNWTGPNGPGDFITIVAAGAPESAYLDYCDTTAGSPCTLTTPDQQGQYELRYVTGANQVVASRPIEIK